LPLTGIAKSFPFTLSTLLELNILPAAHGMMVGERPYDRGEARLDVRLLVGTSGAQSSS
jgi:hypothetical protein